MASVMLGFAVIFSFLALLLVCLGFATNNWIDVAVERTTVKSTLEGTVTNASVDPNTFTRNRGIFKVCYDGTETYFLDNNPDVVSGNCLWITGLLLETDEASINYEDEYDWRNHFIRSHIAATGLGMIALAAGVIVSSIGCWKLNPRVFRMAGLVTFIGSFFVACGMACFHAYDYLEREEINQSQQGIFPKYWQNIALLNNLSKMAYGWSYIVSWVGMGLAAIAGILLLCTAYNLQWDEDYNRYTEKKLKKKGKKQLAYLNEQKQPPEQPVVEVPVEVPVAVPVEPPQVVPVVDGVVDPTYGDAAGVYGGVYGDIYGNDVYGGAAVYGDPTYGAAAAAAVYGGAADVYGQSPYGGLPVFGPAVYGEMDKYWM